MKIIQTGSSIACIQPDSYQLFFLFTGSGLRPVGLHSVDLIARTPLASSNIILLGDLQKSGDGGDQDSAEGMVRWQQDYIASYFPHVREVFCLGVSVGGITAIQTACRLGARAAWSLSGRVIRAEVIEEKLRLSSEIYQRAIGRTRLTGLTPEQEQELGRVFDRPEMRALRWRFADASQVVARDRLSSIVADVRANATVTDCHFYYVETNTIDRECAEAFRSCQRITLHSVRPRVRELQKPIGFSEPDHSIVSILQRRGEWSKLLAAYLPKAGSAIGS